MSRTRLNRPISANASCTAVGSYWTGGDLLLYRRGNTVQLVGSPTLTAINGRQIIATIPQGFRPVNSVYARSSVDNNYYIVTSNGNLQNGGTQPATTNWFSATWVTND